MWTTIFTIHDPIRIEYAGSESDGPKVDYKTKYARQQQVIRDNFAHFDVPYNGADNNDYVDGRGFSDTDGSLEGAMLKAARSQAKSGNKSAGLKNNFQQGDSYEKYQFFYHPDHLGSSSFITDTEGEVVQHIEYVPYGEVFIEERNNVWNSPYLFNAKEFDEETGLYCYGARYYDSRLAMWLGVDSMAEKYPNMGAYVYCANNPVKLVDPDGRDHWEIDAEGNTNKIDDEGDEVFVNDIKLASFNFDTHEKLQSLGAILSYYYGEEGSKAEQLHGGSVSIISYNGYSNMVDSYNWDEEKTPYQGMDKPVAIGVNQTNGYKGEKIAVFVVDGKVSEKFNSKWNVINSFIHEGTHTQQNLVGYGKSGVKDAILELNAYMNQISHYSWSKVTNRQRSLIEHNIKEYICSLYYNGRNDLYQKYYWRFKNKGIKL